MSNTQQPNVIIDGKEYPFSSLSDTAKGQLSSIRACEQKLRALQQEAALLQTARNAYASALKVELNK
jgi:hypothetical protein